MMKFYHILLEWNKCNTLTEPIPKSIVYKSHRTLIHYGRNSNGTVTWKTVWQFLTELNILLQFSSVTQPCPTLCDPMNRSTPGLPTAG